MLCSAKLGNQVRPPAEFRHGAVDDVVLEIVGRRAYVAELDARTVTCMHAAFYANLAFRWETGWPDDVKWGGKE